MLDLTSHDRTLTLEFQTLFRNQNSHDVRWAEISHFWLLVDFFRAEVQGAEVCGQLGDALLTEKDLLNVLFSCNIVNKHLASIVYIVIRAKNGDGRSRKFLSFRCTGKETCEQKPGSTFFDSAALLKGNLNSLSFGKYKPKTKNLKVCLFYLLKKQEVRE